MLNWLERTKTCLLDLDQIELEDTTFLIPFFTTSDALEKSIERFGIVNPPVLQERPGERPVAVLGRRRLLAARKLGVPRVDVRMVAPDMTEQEGFELAFWDNVACRGFDTACTAFVVMRLMALFPKERTARDFLPALNVPQHGPRLERLQAVGNLDFEVLAALASGRLQEKTAWILTKLEPRERSELLSLCDRLALNANKTAEVIENLFDLAMFTNTPIGRMLEREPVRGLLADTELSTPQRSARFRELIKSMKFPDLVAREQEFHEKLAAVGSSQRIAVRPTAGFESPECTVELRCRSVDEAAALVSRLKDTW
jgi:ParB family chromosome partitioning protein